MTQFRYRAFDETGSISQGEMAAPDLDGARENLWALGLTPIEIEEAAHDRGKALFDRLSPGRKIGLRELAAFTREFATLEEADIPIDDGLRILSEQSGHAATQRLAEKLLDDVVDGATLSDAMRGQPDVFALEYVNVVQAGELGGSIARVLGEMADLLERRLELRTKFRSALIYPAILLALAVLSVTIVVSVLVPNIAPIFGDSGRPIPGGLQAILWVGAHWLEFSGILVMTTISLLVVFRAAERRPTLRAALHRRYLSLPLIGSLLARRDVGRFARTLGSLLRAGVPLLPAIESARATVVNAAIAGDLAQSVEFLRDGAPLSRALEDVVGIPPLARRMIAVGEESGRLAAMLTQVAQTLETQVQHTIARAMNLLTPALTVAIAGLVGGLILSVMNAILSINELAVK